MAGESTMPHWVSWMTMRAGLSTNSDVNSERRRARRYRLSDKVLAFSSRFDLIWRSRVPWQKSVVEPQFQWRPLNATQHHRELFVRSAVPQLTLRSQRDPSRAVTRASHLLRPSHTLYHHAAKADSRRNGGL